MLLTIAKWFLLFTIYSVIGYILEVLEVSLKKKKVTNRGFLFGPVCPIYGFGGVAMCLASDPFKDSPILVFLISMATCTVIEYITSFLMEKLFRIRWWDYSNTPYNLNGRVCLQASLAFGALGMLFVYYLHPFFLSILDIFPNIVIWIATGLAAAAFLTDTIMSTIATTKIKYLVDGTMKDVTSQAKKLAASYYVHHKKIIDRLKTLNIKNIKRK